MCFNGGGVGANNLQNTGPHFSTVLPSDCVFFPPLQVKFRETIKSHEHFLFKPVFMLDMYRLDRLFKHTLNPRGSENRDAFYTQANGDAVWQERYICQHTIKHTAETTEPLQH